MTCRRLLPLMIIIALLGTLCTGCWNRREPELLGVVLAVGFDFDEENDTYLIFAQLADPIAMGGGAESEGGGSGGERSFWTMQAKGRTPFAAVRNLINTSSRALFWPHCRVLLLSEKLARRGIANIFDLFERGRQFRLIVKPAIVAGDLREIMEAEFPLEETGARGLDRLILTTRFERSIFPEKNLNELIATHAQPGKEMLIGRLTVLDTEAGKQGEGGGNENIPPPARLGGCAFFRGDRMVGWASPCQTQGWGYGSGRAFRSTFVVKSPAKEENCVSIETFGHDARMRLRGDDNNWRIELKVKLHGRIQEFDSPGKLDTENELTHSLERRAAQAVRNNIEAALSRSQELKSDIFGFGNLIHRKNPWLWKKIHSRWDEEIFPQLTIDLIIEFDILHSGMVKNSVEED